MTTTRPGYIWSGTEWVAIGQEAVVAPVSYQTSAPSTPATGDIWIDSDDDVPGIDTSQFLRWRKTMAGGETSLSGTDDNGLTLAYTPNYEQLYINGVLQVRAQDYTATNGTSITGLTALAANDVVEVFGVVARTVGDVYTQAQADGKYSLQTTTGLVLLNTTTLGSAITSVTISNVFSSSYTNYQIVYSDCTSGTPTQLRFSLGGITTGVYENSELRADTRTTTVTSSPNGPGIAYWRATTTEQPSFIINIMNPNTTKNKTINGFVSAYSTSQSWISGFVVSSVQSTDFILTLNGGTLTGGTIKVYGYK